MLIEVGKRYLRADGGITARLRIADSKNYPFVDSYGDTYTENGKLYIGLTTDMDLIAEVPEYMMEGFINNILDHYERELK